MSTIEIKVPDIGDFHDVPVIEVLMKVGDRVEKEQSLLTLESDKATMEVPSDQSGEIKSVTVKVGDKVSQGMVIATIEVSATATAPKTTTPTATPTATQTPAAVTSAPIAGSYSGTVEDRKSTRLNSSH